MCDLSDLEKGPANFFKNHIFEILGSNGEKRAISWLYRHKKDKIGLKRRGARIGRSLASLYFASLSTDFTESKKNSIYTHFIIIVQKLAHAKFFDFYQYHVRAQKE